MVKDTSEGFNVPEPSGAAITQINEASDIAQAAAEMNKDVLDPQTGMSDIDLKSRLNEIQIEGLVEIEALIGLHFLPRELLIMNRQIKRNWVSYQGLGRKEYIDLVNGIRQGDQKAGIMERMFGKK